MNNQPYSICAAKISPLPIHPRQLSYFDTSTGIVPKLTRANKKSKQDCFFLYR